MLIKIYIVSIFACLVFGELVVLRFKSIVGNGYKKKKRTILEGFVFYIRGLGFTMIPILNIISAITFAILFFFASDEWYKDAFGEDKEC
ncbi:hypothetical protein [Clostridium sp.]|uniref:hypothetical protein n=1 Tax=Clostridium sp. TaxID=1506 RepID=UPI002908E2AD|nr:hypothetical protein [Clostridium sp.]MDU7212495.1 hypothetical protein [Clostridium sp.]